MAVRAVRRGATHDLRYGFGLLSLKVREGGGWLICSRRGRCPTRALRGIRAARG